MEKTKAVTKKIKKKRILGEYKRHLKSNICKFGWGGQ